jgi:hypothetical protein
MLSHDWKAFIGVKIGLMLLMTSTPLLTRCPFSREIDTPCGRSHRRLATECTNRDRSNYLIIEFIAFILFSWIIPTLINIFFRKNPPDVSRVRVVVTVPRRLQWFRSLGTYPYHLIDFRFDLRYLGGWHELWYVSQLTVSNERTSNNWQLPNTRLTTLLQRT